MTLFNEIKELTNLYLESKYKGSIRTRIKNKKIRPDLNLEFMESVKAILAANCEITPPFSTILLEDGFNQVDVYSYFVCPQENLVVSHHIMQNFSSITDNPWTYGERLFLDDLQSETDLRLFHPVLFSRPSSRLIQATTQRMQERDIERATQLITEVTQGAYKPPITTIEDNRHYNNRPVPKFFPR